MLFWHKVRNDTSSSHDIYDNAITSHHMSTMEFFRAGEAIIRSTQPLLPFLAPSAYRTPRQLGGIARHYGRQHLEATPTSSRTLSTTCKRQQPAPDSPTPSQRATTTGEEFSAILDSALDTNKTPPTPRPSNFKSAFQQRENRRPTPAPITSATELTADLWNAENAKPLPRPSNTFSRIDADAIFGVVPGSKADIASRPPPPPPQAAPMKLDSSVGRTIHVNADKGVDVGKAFRMLEMRCAQNSVKRDFMRQRFHERQGLKRKRLKQERWRRRFKETFRATVGMVVRMKGQGW